MVALRQNFHQIVGPLPMAALDDWAAGVPLTDAPWHFARPKLRAKFGDALTTKDQRIEESEKRMMAAVSERDTATQLGVLGENTLAILEADSPVADVVGEMRDRFCEGLRTGKWVAIGYQFPREVSDLPVRIPVDVLAPRYLNWKDSTANGAGLRFVSIRVARPNDRTGLRTLIPQTGASNPTGLAAGFCVTQKGRPSVKRIVLRAYETLNAAGRIDSTAPLAGANVDAINTFITQRGLWPRKLAHETIRRHIGRDFDQMKQSTKQ